MASSLKVPDTPLVKYFRKALFGTKGDRFWKKRRLGEAQRLLEKPEELAELFRRSVEAFEARYRNSQPFYPSYHRFTAKHGLELRRTVDVAARLAGRDRWPVEGNASLDFVYLDRELELARAKPGPAYPPKAKLILDLLLANAQDSTPILCEVKVKKDQSPFYALIQLLAQAAYAVAPSQRERLVLWGSTPDRVLREAVSGNPSRTDLYVMLVERDRDPLSEELLATSMHLGAKLLRSPEVSRYLRRIAWLEANDDGRGGLSMAVLPRRS